jgi:hypothetical protein
MEYRRTPKTENFKKEYPVILKQIITRNTKTENSKMEYPVILKRNITRNTKTENSKMYHTKHLINVFFCYSSIAEMMIGTMMKVIQTSTT